MNNTAFLEVVVYTVHDADNFLPLVDRAEATIRPLTTGLRWWSHWESEDGEIRADIVCWATPAEAYAAAEIMSKNPKLSFFTAAIDSIQHFSHYWAKASPDTLREVLNDGNRMLELALFTSADEAATQRLQPVLHEKVSKEAGCQVHFPLKDAKNEAGFGDLAVWTNPASHRVAGKKLTADPELKAYFSAIAKLEVFQLFYLSKVIENAPQKATGNHE